MIYEVRQASIPRNDNVAPYYSHLPRDQEQPTALPRESITAKGDEKSSAAAAAGIAHTGATWTRNGTRSGLGLKRAGTY